MAVLLPVPEIPTNGTDAPQAAAVLSAQPWIPVTVPIVVLVLAAPAPDQFLSVHGGFPL